MTTQPSAAPVTEAAQASTTVTEATQAPSAKPSEEELAPEAAPTKPNVSAERFSKLVEREQKLRKDREAYKKEQEATHASLAKYREAAELVDKDPLAALEKLGFQWSDVANKLVNRPRTDPAKDALAEVQKLKAEIEAKELQSQHGAVQQKLAEFKTQCVEFVKSDADKYELINAHGLGEEVYNLIAEHWKTSEEVLSPQEAADILEEQLTQRAQVFLAAKKFKKSEATASAPTANATPARNVAQTANSDGPRTLTNHVSAQRSDSAPHSGNEEKERIRRAIARLSGS